MSSDRIPGRAQQVGGSLWIARRTRSLRAAAVGTCEVDVAIIGGGMVGCSAAMLLAAEGSSVALLEARSIGDGNTGLSTAKATCFHGTNFSSLVDTLGTHGAHDIIAGERAALDVMRRWTEELGISDAARSVWHWAYASGAEGIEQLEAQAAVAADLDVDVRWAEEGECPLGARALGIADQLNIDPIPLLDAFADRAERHGARVHEHTRVIDVELDSTCILRTDGGATIRAKHVINATQLPTIDRSMVFAGAGYRRSHVIAIEHPGAFAFAPDMYTGIDPDALSMRAARDVDGTPMLIVAGHGHALADDEDGTHVARLEQAAREATGAGELRRAWLAHDVFPSDGLPFVGPIHGHDNVHVATGFAGWGLAAGVTASMAISGLILRGHARWHDAMSAKRLGPYVRPDAIREGATTVGAFVGDRMSSDDLSELASLEPGTGMVARVDGQMVAIARDRDNQLRAVDAKCTHLGCVVRHEPEAACWQCPCHGSRFGLDGTVLQGPAVDALERVDVSELDLPGAGKVE